MHSSCDFLIAGAGPAGSRAAELLARTGARVLLLDPRAPWEKPCGGGLSAAALAHTPELAELGDRWERIDQLLVVAPGGATATVPLSRPFVAVSRLVLGRWGLERATGAGATFVPRAVREIERRPGAWLVTDATGTRYSARWVLAADGAASRLRTRLAPGLKPELAPTRVAYPAGGPTAGTAVLLLFPRSQGYLWDFPRGGDHSVGVALAPGTFGRAVLDQVIRWYLDYGRPPHREPACCGAVVPTRNWAAGRWRDLGGTGYALLGDAAGLADPLTGEGIDYALQSAALAAGAFDQRNGFRRYPTALRRALRPDTLRWRLFLGLLYRPRVVDWLIAAANRSERNRLALAALLDAVNQHLPVGAVARRILASVAA